MEYGTVVLLSSGIDSPVAAYLMAETGADVKLLHLDNRPFTSEENIDTADQLAKVLKDRFNDIQYYRAPFGDIQKKIAKVSDPAFRCVVCRRMMYRCASILSKKTGANSLSTGESLGQVASQTLSNLRSEDIITDMPIHRPLIGLDKNEIIDIARSIETYNISIRPGTCCMLTPDKPRVKSDVIEVSEEESKIDYSSVIEELEFERVF